MIQSLIHLLSWLPEHQKSTGHLLSKKADSPLRKREKKIHRYWQIEITLRESKISKSFGCLALDNENDSHRPSDVRGHEKHKAKQTVVANLRNGEMACDHSPPFYIVPSHVVQGFVRLTDCIEQKWWDKSSKSRTAASIDIPSHSHSCSPVSYSEEASCCFEIRTTNTSGLPGDRFPGCKTPRTKSRRQPGNPDHLSCERSKWVRTEASV